MVESSHPKAADVIRHDFYVDDLLTGAACVENLQIIKSEVSQILQGAGVELTKWFSNSPEFSATNASKPITISESDTSKTLGVLWLPTEDVFQFKIDDSFMGLRATKRNILSVSSRLFDPLGLLRPLIIKAKILLQELWLQKLDWYESIPLSLDNSWQQLKSTLIQLQRIRIPRYVFTEPTLPIEIHGFADASMRAFGACVYIRSHTAEATFVSNRVAEIQEWTENAEWRHVPTKQNPADIVSRGCDVDELVTSIWFNGPSFLKEPRDSWPVNQHLVTDEMRTLEVRKTAIGLTAMVHRPDLLETIDSYSSHARLLRVFVYVFRFIKKCSSAVEESHRPSIATKRRTSSEPVASFGSCGPESRRRRTQLKNSHQKADADSY
ncbi:hypothetical protein ACLKA6_004304 [Drosophila palustris]